MSETLVHLSWCNIWVIGGTCNCGYYEKKIAADDTELATLRARVAALEAALNEIVDTATEEYGVISQHNTEADPTLLAFGHIIRSSRAALRDK